MGNALEGTARFSYGGQTYHLVLSNRVWIDAESVLGYSILDAVEELRAALQTGRNPRLKTMCAIVYGGLCRQHPDISEDDVVDMFLSGDKGFRDAVLEAMQGAQLPDAPTGAVASAVGKAPGAKAATGKTGARKSAGTGKKSSRNGAKPATRRPRS